MDMAIETPDEQISAICNLIPAQCRIGTSNSMLTVASSVAKMAAELRRQSGAIADLQLALADARRAKPTDEQALADMIGRIAEMVEADTALEITGTGDIYVHFDGKAYESDQIGALEMLDAAGTLARSARRG